MVATPLEPTTAPPVQRRRVIAPFLLMPPPLLWMAIFYILPLGLLLVHAL